MTALLATLIVISAVALCGALVILASIELERRRRRWEWEHPPEEDACREDDADEQDSRQ